jgi:outer membrane protein W
LLIPKKISFQYFSYNYSYGGENHKDTIYRWELSFPILAKYYLTPVDAKLRPFIVGGIHIAGIISAVDETSVYTSSLYTEDVTLKNQTDYGFILGAGADIRMGEKTHLSLEGRFQLDQAKLDNVGLEPAKTYLLGLFAGIKF